MISAVLMLVFASAGCTSDADDSSEMMTAEEFVAEYNEQSLQAYCQAVFSECDNMGMHRHWDSPAARISSRDECLESAELKEWLAGDMRDVVETVGWELAEFDAASARACLDEMEGLREEDRCWSTRIDVPDDCDAVLVGTLGESEPCLFDSMCESGFCLPASAQSEANKCYGECQKSPPEVGDGDPCDDPVNAVACDRQPGLTCQPAIQEEGRVCVPVGSRSDGNPCDGRMACGNGLSCHFNQCAKIELGDVGDECDLLSRLNPCAPHLGCLYDGGDPACTELVEPGGACESSHECTLDHRCKDDVCQPMAEFGQECHHDGDCGAGLRCHDDEEIEGLGTCEQAYTGYDLCALPDDP